MTVAELIEALLQMPQEANVYLEAQGDVWEMNGVYIDEDGDVRVADAEGVSE